jgi:hypothetical protein
MNRQQLRHALRVLVLGVLLGFALYAAYLAAGAVG